MAAKAHDQIGMTFGNQIERIAQMQARDRAPGTFDDVVAAFGKHDGRAMQFVFDAAGDDADHALMPVVAIQADAPSRIDRDACEDRFGFFAHARFNFAARAVHLIQLTRNRHGGGFGAGQEAGNAQTHVIKPAGSIEARPDGKAQIEAARARPRTPRRVENGHDAGASLTGADALEPLFDEDAVVVVEPNHVGHGAERDDVEPLREIGFGLAGKGIALAQLGAQRHQHIKHHADAGEMLAWKGAAGLVRIDDQCVRNRVAGQVVIGDDHFDAQLAGALDAGMAGDAVVDGQNQLRRARGGKIDNLRGQAVTVLKAVGYDEVDNRAHRP